jgi:hypothetical protein
MQIRLHYNPETNTVLCEVCGSRVGLGRGKTDNYHKTHKNTPTCLAQKAKAEREGKRLEALANKPAVKPNRSLFDYVKAIPRLAASTSKTKSAPVPSSSKANRVPAHITISDYEDNPGGSSTITATTTSVSNRGASNILLVQELRDLAAALPEAIPEATEADVLAQYAKDPSSFDHPTAHGEAIWEAGLNKALKDGLGWGDGQTDWDIVIRRGSWGVDGLVKLVEYFVGQRGVPESLFEGKLTLIKEEMRKR